SNADLRFTRNRIRAELLPLLRTFNPEIVSVLDRLADQASEAFAVLETGAAALLAEAGVARGGERRGLRAPQPGARPPAQGGEAACGCCGPARAGGQGE